MMRERGPRVGEDLYSARAFVQRTPRQRKPGDCAALPTPDYRIFALNGESSCDVASSWATAAAVPQAPDDELANARAWSECAKAG